MFLTFMVCVPFAMHHCSLETYDGQRRDLDRGPGGQGNLSPYNAVPGGYRLNESGDEAVANKLPTTRAECQNLVLRMVFQTKNSGAGKEVREGRNTMGQSRMLESFFM